MLFPRESLLQEAHAFLSRPGENQVGAEEALSPDLAGLPLFDPPLLGISAAHDPLYATLKAPEAIGPWPLPGGVAARGGLGAVLFLPLFPGGHPEQPADTGCPLPCLAPRPGGGAGPSLSLGPSPGRPAPGCRLAGLMSLFGPPVCLHGTPGHRPPVSFPGRLYQPVVRAPRRLYQRPGDLRPAQRPHHRTGNLRAVCQRPD